MPLWQLIALAVVLWIGAALVLASVVGARWQSVKPAAVHTPPADTPEEGTHV